MVAVPTAHGSSCSSSNSRSWLTKPACPFRFATIRQGPRNGTRSVCHEHISEKGGVELYERWGWAPRDRQSGAGLKPLQAAVVKSDGGERCSKRRDSIPSGMVWRGEREQTVDDVSKFHGRCQNRGCDLLPGSARGWP